MVGSRLWCSEIQDQFLVLCLGPCSASCRALSLGLQPNVIEHGEVLMACASADYMYVHWLECEHTLF